MPLNRMIRSLPLHHAAAAGNFGAVIYLTSTCKAPVNDLDRNEDTAAHQSFINGHKHIGDYLCELDATVRLMKNKSGQTPKMLGDAFRKYEKLYDSFLDEDRNDASVKLTEQVDSSVLSTKLLEHWLSKSKCISFRNIMTNSIVDYSSGEAKQVKSLMFDFASLIGNQVAEYNPLLKGSLFLVGSAGDNVRLNAPDEYDCTWVLDLNNVRVQLQDMADEEQLVKKYKHTIITESEDTEIKDLLTGTNLLEEFYKQCVKSVSLHDPHRLDPRLSLILPGVKRIGCGVCITLAWSGDNYPLMIVNLDLVPAVKASRPANFCRPPLTKDLKDPRLESIYVVQTHINAGEKRCATTLEEQVIMENLTEGQHVQHLIFMIAKLLVSKLKTEKWSSKIIKERFTFFSTKNFKLPAPTGFLLKSAFFGELEREKDPAQWKENCIVDRLKGIFYSMCIARDDNASLVSGLVPSYFSSTTQPPAAGFMAPAIYKFLVDNEEVLRKMEYSTSYNTGT